MASGEAYDARFQMIGVALGGYLEAGRGGCTSCWDRLRWFHEAQAQAL